MSRTKQSVPSLSIYTKWVLNKSNSRCLEQICWSLSSSRYRELTVHWFLFISILSINIIRLKIWLKNNRNNNRTIEKNNKNISIKEAEKFFSPAYKTKRVLLSSWPGNGFNTAQHIPVFNTPIQVIKIKQNILVFTR